MRCPSPLLRATVFAWVVWGIAARAADPASAYLFTYFTKAKLRTGEK